jgi:hypothetical protein
MTSSHMRGPIHGQLGSGFDAQLYVQNVMARNALGNILSGTLNYTQYNNGDFESFRRPGKTTLATVSGNREPNSATGIMLV